MPQHFLQHSTCLQVPQTNPLVFRAGDHTLSVGENCNCSYGGLVIFKPSVWYGAYDGLRHLTGAGGVLGRGIMGEAAENMRLFIVNELSSWHDQLSVESRSLWRIQPFDRRETDSTKDTPFPCGYSLTGTR